MLLGVETEKLSFFLPLSANLQEFAAISVESKRGITTLSIKRACELFSGAGCSPNVSFVFNSSDLFKVIQKTRETTSQKNIKRLLNELLFCRDLT